jgi:spermidine synthase
MSSADSWRRLAPLALMLASGFAGLGYQIVWTQQCGLWLGHEAAGVLAVITAFFGGIAVGALVLGGPIEKSRRPAHWYAGCELLIAVWGLVLTVAMAPVSSGLLSLIGVQPSPAWQWAVAFVGTFLLLLPATAAMGATLPAIERMTGEMRREGRSIAALYASNTFGAVVGVLATAFWLVPELGLTRTVYLCVALSLLCAAVALGISRSTTEVALARADTPTVPDALLAARRLRAAYSGKLALTGLLGIGYEVLAVRVLSQVTEDTVYTFAMLLAIYLLGSAAGAAAYSGWLKKRGKPDSTNALSDSLLTALAIACLVGTASLWGAESIKNFALATLGPTLQAAIAEEALLALIAFGPATFVMGAVFSHLTTTALASGMTFGQALGANTLGAATAPVIFGVLALPLLGPKISLLLMALGYLALTNWRQWRKPMLWLPTSVAAAMTLLAPPLAFIDVPEGGHIVSYREGVMATVSVVEDANGVSRLRIDNRQQEGSSATMRVDGRQALLPVLLHTSPRHVLFLGLGTGITASTAAEDPTLQVDAVELLPEVIDASAHFTSIFTEGDRPNARLNLIAADARRYVRASNQSYDVIVSDNFHPARSGSGALYTVEHFNAVRARLAPGGLFCQWLPLHQLDLETLRSIVQSFLVAYPDGFALLASNSLETPVIGLVGREGGQRFDAGTLAQRLAKVAQPERITSAGFEDEFALLGSFIAGPKALKRFAGNAPANTDDHPVVAYRAPHITYAPDSLPRDRLLALLADVSIAPSELLAPTPANTLASASAAAIDTSARLAAYWRARDRFIESGRSVRPVPDVQAMLAQVRAPLLSVLHISPDFRPAYDPLMRMAMALSQTDAREARALLAELAQAQPSRPEAARALHELGPY